MAETKGKVRIGRVVSDKMEKTVVVSIQSTRVHPIYKKMMRRSKNFMAHDEKGAHVGDIVRIVESRPISKLKTWRVVEILEHKIPVSVADDVVDEVSNQ
jgi:small subunit ribosomal protein S17